MLSAADVISTLREGDPVRRGLLDPLEEDDSDLDFIDEALPGASERELLLSALSYTPVAVDELIKTTALSAGAVQTLLLGLDLEGRIEWSSGQLVALKA